MRSRGLARDGETLKLTSLKVNQWQYYAMVVAMYIETIPNRNSRPAILLREAWREGKKIGKRTIANLTSWPDEKIEALRRLLRGDKLIAAERAVVVERSIPHG